MLEFALSVDIDPVVWATAQEATWVARTLNILLIFPRVR